VVVELGVDLQPMLVVVPAIRTAPLSSLLPAFRLALNKREPNGSPRTEVGPLPTSTPTYA